MVTGWNQPLQPAAREEAPGVLETFGAGFRQENVLVSALAKGRLPYWAVQTPQPGFDPYSGLVGSQYEPFLDRFRYTNSPEDVAVVKGDIDRELYDREVLDRSPWGFTAMLMAGVIDPVNLIPVGSAVAKSRTAAGLGARLARGFAAGARMGAVGVGIQEAGLKGLQETRSWPEVGVNVAGGALLAGVLGSAGSALMGRELTAQAQIVDAAVKGYHEAGAVAWHPMKTRMRNTWISAGLETDQVDAVLALLEAGPIAKWMERTGKPVADWYESMLGDVRLLESGEVEASVLQRLQEAAGGLEGVKGATMFEDGKALMYAVRNAADISTMIHELSHVWEKTLTADELRLLGAVEGKGLTVDQKELLARGVEYVFREGALPEWVPSALRPIVQKIADWMVTVYQSLRDVPLIRSMDPEMRTIIEEHWLARRGVLTPEERLQAKYPPKPAEIITKTPPQRKFPKTKEEVKEDMEKRGIPVPPPKKAAPKGQSVRGWAKKIKAGEITVEEVNAKLSAEQQAVLEKLLTAETKQYPAFLNKAIEQLQQWGKKFSAISADFTTWFRAQNLETLAEAIGETKDSSVIEGLLERYFTIQMPRMVDRWVRSRPQADWNQIAAYVNDWTNNSSDGKLFAEWAQMGDRTEFWESVRSQIDEKIQQRDEGILFQFDRKGWKDRDELITPGTHVAFRGTRGMYSPVSVDPRTKGPKVVWFSADWHYADQSYAHETGLNYDPGTRVTVAKVEFRNPFDWRNPADYAKIREVVEDVARKSYYMERKTEKELTYILDDIQRRGTGYWSITQNERVLQAIKDLGYDAIIDYEGFTINYGLFSEKQAKAYWGGEPLFQVEAWHGTPHEFDRFETQKIGTGEGHQAYGWGLYFTEKEAIARYYADNLSLKKGNPSTLKLKNNRPISDYITEADVSDLKSSFKGSSIKTLRGIREKEIKNALFYGYNQEQTLQFFKDEKLKSPASDQEYFDNMIRVLSKLPEVDFPPYRNLYKVTLNKGKDPSEYKWLDWEQIISEDNANKIYKIAQEKIQEIPPAQRVEMNEYYDFWNFIMKSEAYGNVAGYTGQEFYNELTNKLSGFRLSPKDASLFLKECGFDGIRYPTEYLSGKPSDKYNYVVFDENAVTIEEHILYQKITPENFEEIRQGIHNGSIDAHSLVRPQWMPKWAMRMLSLAHPSLRVKTLQHLKTPSAWVSKLFNDMEWQMKHLVGESDGPTVEGNIKKFENVMQAQFYDGYWGPFGKMIRRMEGAAANEQDIGNLRLLKEKIFNHTTVKEWRRKVFAALLELSEGKQSILGGDLSARFEPEVIEAAQNLGKMFNEIGKQLAKAGLLPENLKEPLEGGFVHVPRIYNHQAVEEFRELFKQILEADLARREAAIPFEDTGAAGESAPAEANFNLDDTIDAILGSPLGYIGTEITETGVLDTGTVRHLQERALAIESGQLIVPHPKRPGEMLEFIITDPEQVFKRYVSNISPDLALAEFNVGDITLKNMFEEIKGEAETLAGERPDLKSEIFRERDEAVRDMKALRDILRHSYRRADPRSALTRASNTLLSMNTLQMLGGVMVSSLPDIVRPLFDWGFHYYTPAMMNYFAYMRSPEFKRWKMEATRIWGVAGDMYTHGRYAQMADVAELGADRSWIEKIVRTANDNQGLLSGMDWWNTQLKLLTSFVTSHAVLDVAKKLKAGKSVDSSWVAQIANMGIGADLLPRIADQVEKFGETYDGMILANTARWEDMQARLAFEGGILRETDHLIVTPGAGDKPLWAHYQMAKHLMQFKSYPMAAMRHIVFRGLQDPDAKLGIALLFSIGVGGLTYSIKQLEKGQEITADPRQFLYEAFDRAGIAGYLIDLNNYLERASGYKFGITGVSPTRVFGLQATTRMQYTTDILDLAFGPTGATMKAMQHTVSNTLPHMVGDAVGMSEMTRDDWYQAQQLLWFSRLMGIRSALEWLRGQAVKATVPRRTGTEG